MKKLIRTYGAVVMAMVFWSFSFVWYKIANEVYRPLTIVFLRLCFSVIILTLFLLFTGRFEKIRKADMKYFLLLSFFEPFLYFIGESYGLTYVSSTVGSVIISTVPIFAAVGGWIFYTEKLRAINYLGIVISFAGVLIFIMNSDGKLLFDIKGLGLLFLAVLSAVSYTLILKKLAGTYHPVYIVNVQNILGVLFFIPVVTFTEIPHLGDFVFNPKAFLSIIELAIFASCGAFILFGFAVRSLGVSKASVFSNCIPVLTAIFAFWLLGEKMSGRMLLGMLIVISGLFLSQRNKKKGLDREFLAGKTG